MTCRLADASVTQVTYDAGGKRENTLVNIRPRRLPDVRFFIAFGTKEHVQSIHPRSLRRTPPMRRIAALCRLSLIVAVAGCASVMPVETETYRCAGGQEFTVAFTSSDSARLDLGGMNFALQLEPVGGKGSTYGCSVLKLWRDGTAARLSVDGTGEPAICHRVP